jgi:hypothetical protein
MNPLSESFTGEQGHEDGEDGENDEGLGTADGPTG